MVMVEESSASCYGALVLRLEETARCDRQKRSRIIMWPPSLFIHGLVRVEYVETRNAFLCSLAYSCLLKNCVIVYSKSSRVLSVCPAFVAIWAKPGESSTSLRQEKIIMIG
jgi:hypothetical protein